MTCAVLRIKTIKTGEGLQPTAEATILLLFAYVSNTHKVEISCVSNKATTFYDIEYA